MIFKLVESIDGDSIILYRSGDLNSSRGIWMSSSEGYAKTYGSGIVNKYKVKLGNTIEVEGYPQTCPFLMYNKLYKKPLKGTGYFGTPIAQNVDDLTQSEVNRLTKVYIDINPNGYDKPVLNGKNYVPNSIILQYALDYLNAIQAKKLGYDTIIYRMKDHAKDEYCILNKNNILEI